MQVPACRGTMRLICDHADMCKAGTGDVLPVGSADDVVFLAYPGYWCKYSESILITFRLYDGKTCHCPWAKEAGLKEPTKLRRCK